MEWISITNILLLGIFLIWEGYNKKKRRKPCDERGFS